MTTEKRRFRLDDNAISLLIQSQAGSLQKAILEAVANALDAGSSYVKVDLSAERVFIEDDGRGFRSKKELSDFFECFGFDHSKLDRKVGRFGVGRGQLFHFGHNLWTTNEFTMEVDVRKDMQGYDLGQSKVPYQGVKIDIGLYDPLSFTQLTTVETELKKLVRFCPIPVLLNGVEVQKDPAKQTWDEQTDEAWFKLDDSHEIRVYSQGLFVQALPAYQFGKGGVVVTKLGHPLKQNMARNDTLITDCAVWKRVRKSLDSLSGAHRKKASAKPTMTEALRASLTTTTLHGDGAEDFQTLQASALFTLTNGKHVRLETLLASGFVSSADNKDPGADLLMQRGQAMILAPQSLSRAEVGSTKELGAKIKKTLKRYLKTLDADRRAMNGYKDYHNCQRLLALCEKCVFKDTVAELPMTANTELVEVKASETSKEERLALSVIRRNLMPGLSYDVWNHLNPDKRYNSRWSFEASNVRKIQLAVSEAFQACTDGASKVWLDRKFLADAIAQGPVGFVRLTHVLVHELLHDVDTATGHDHDHDFYQAYHDLTTDGNVSAYALTGYRSFLARGGRATSYALKEMERGQMITPAETDERRASIANAAANDKQLLEEELAGEAAQALAAKPAPKRRSKARPSA
jgi:hypothetical protein